MIGRSREGRPLSPIVLLVLLGPILLGGPEGGFSSLRGADRKANKKAGKNAEDAAFEKIREQFDAEKALD
ncbi:MAG TPA: hypothetical protein VMT52_01130, partial [Planctomycetota bacterium]|nr:hypothetical protein [Planctomycetota bacterium]